MKGLIHIIFVICIMLVLVSCENERTSNIIHRTHAYDVLKLNDTTYMTVPTGLTWDGDTITPKIFYLHNN